MPEKEKGQDAKKRKKLNNFLKHPLFIAFVSSLIFGGAVALITTHLQNRNWIRQHRAELAERLFYLNKKRETNAWSLFSSCKNDDRASHLRYSDTRAEIINETHAIKQQLAIYFGDKEKPKLLGAENGISEIWFAIEDRLSKYPSCKELTEKEIKNEAKKAEDYEKEIIDIFSRILYK